MKLLQSSLFACLLALLAISTNRTVFPSLGDSATAEDRRLLVTFANKTIDRKLTAKVLEGYRLRSQYSNSGWGERVARELADRHHILFIAQWPVAALGLSCVVYDVPEQLQLQQVMVDLRKDRQISLVQQMHSFQVLGDHNRSYNDP